MSGGSTPLDGGRRFQFFDDLWAFDGKRWAQLPSSGDMVSGIRLAYDTRQSRVFSFGGFNGRESMSALRTLDAGAWKTIGVNAAPKVAESGFLYDSKRDRFIAFGGSAGMRQVSGDTWEYDRTTWKHLGVPGPPARQSHAMVFDKRRGRTVLFGGMGVGQARQQPPMFGDTWEFDGTAWKQIDVTGPSARSGAGMTYDSKRGLVILFGGSDETGNKGDTWSWDGARWKVLSTSGPAAREMGYIAYDRRRDRVVLFGGRNGWPDSDLGDTWEWDGSAWHEFNPPNP